IQGSRPGLQTAAASRLRSAGRRRGGVAEPGGGETWATGRAAVPRHHAYAVCIGRARNHPACGCIASELFPVCSPVRALSGAAGGEGRVVSSLRRSLRSMCVASWFGRPSAALSLGAWSFRAAFAVTLFGWPRHIEHATRGLADGLVVYLVYV